MRFSLALLSLLFCISWNAQDLGLHLETAGTKTGLRGSGNNYDAYRARLAFSYGLEYQHHLNEQWVLSAILTYRDQGYRLDIRDLTFGDVIADPTGLGPGEVIRYVELNGRYSFLSFGLLPEYALMVKEKSRLRFGLGPNFNYYLKTITWFSHSEIKKKDRTLYSNEDERNKALVLGGQARLIYGFELGEKLKAGVGPSVFMTLSSVREESLDQRLISYGLHSSLTYSLR